MDSIPILRDFNSQVPSSLSSLSCPSEPPDVGNWFSSYEYRSPDPDSNFSLEESALRERESHSDEEQEADFEEIKAPDEGAVREKEKLVQCSGTSVKVDNHNEDLCLNKNLDSFSSCSLISEPPDIRNWFSSYVYESFVSDTSSPSRDEEVSEENKRGDERFDFQVMNEDEGRTENVHPKVCAEHNSSSDKNMKGDSSAEMKTSSTIADTSHLEKILQPCIQDKALQHNLGPTKHEEVLNPNNGSPGCNREAHPMSLVQKHDDTKETKSKAEIQPHKLDIGASLAKSFSPKRSPTCTRDKENDGFVTTRKNSCTGANDENSWKKPGKVSLECSENRGRVPPLACEKNAVTKRKALAEATNLQQPNAMGITGKWQCPQKRKPDVGPALKQLRLERWVRRV